MVVGGGREASSSAKRFINEVKKKVRDLIKPPSLDPSSENFAPQEPTKRRP